MTIPVVFETTCDATLIAGLFALGGAIVGALIGGLSAYIVAVRNERASRLEIQRKENKEIRTAIRLIGLEFLSGSSAAELMIKRKEWLQAIQLSASAWEAYSPILAPAVSGDDFFTIQTASIALKDLIGIRKSVFDLGKTELSEEECSGLAPIQSDIRRGAEVLRAAELVHQNEKKQ